MDNKIGPSPFMRLLGVELKEAKYPRASLVLKFNDKLTNPMKTLHGGVISSLVDIGLGCTLYQDSKVRGIATIELKVNYLKAISRGTINIEAEIIHRKNATAFGQVFIYNDETLPPLGAEHKLTEVNIRVFLRTPNTPGGTGGGGRTVTTR